MLSGRRLGSSANRLGQITGGVITRICGIIVIQLITTECDQTAARLQGVC